MPCFGSGTCCRSFCPGELVTPLRTAPRTPRGIDASGKAEDGGHGGQGELGGGRGGRLMGSPGGGKGPWKERDGDLTGKSGGEEREQGDAEMQPEEENVLI